MVGRNSPAIEVRLKIARLAGLFRPTDRWCRPTRRRFRPIGSWYCTGETFPVGSRAEQISA
jgi:hypothetical protein